jgi:O-antigen biosynthesis protein
MKSFYRFNFKDEISEEEFSVKQKELVLDKALPNKKFKFSAKEVEYKGKSLISEHFDNSLPCILIPIRDNSKLLSITLKNLRDNKVDTQSNIIIIDDRSEEDLLVLVSDRESYVRVDNDKGFNFSMLNNIAAKLCTDRGCSEIILWNSDLWVPNEIVFPKLLKRFRELDVDILGTKLVYPPMEMSLNGERDTQNIKQFAPHVLGGKWRETVQFGGDIYNNGLFHHYGRFRDPMEYRVNCNRPSNFITGAFQIIKLKSFIDVGGLNPSLSKNFQDNDFCLKILENGGKIFYEGKDVFLYHDESAILYKEKKDKQTLSDQVLFSKIWNEKIMEII